MKLSYVAPVQKINNFQERISKLHWQAFRKSLFKILTYLTTFCIGLKVSAINIAKLFSTYSVGSGVKENILNIVGTVDASMYAVVTIFSLMVIISLVLQGSQLDWKTFGVTLLKALGATCLVYILYLSCGTWVGWLFAGLSLVLGI